MTFALSNKLCVCMCVRGCGFFQCGFSLVPHVLGDECNCAWDPFAFGALAVCVRLF